MAQFVPVFLLNHYSIENLRLQITTPALFKNTFLTALLCLASFGQSLAQKSYRFDVVEKKLKDIPKHLMSDHHYGNTGMLGVSGNFEAMVDKKGYTWFSTGGGISRYDGYTFKHFEAKDGLPDPVVIHTYEDYKGRIWIIPLSGVLSYLEEGVIREYKYNAQVGPLLNYDNLSSIYVDTLDNLHLGTYGQGYFKVSPKGILTNPISDKTHPKGIGIILFDNQPPFCFHVGNPFKSSQRTVIYSPSLNKIHEIDACKDGCQQHYSATTRVIKLSTGTYLQSYENVIAKFNLNGNVDHFYFPANVIAIHEDHNGGVWASIKDSGLYYYPDGLTHEASPNIYFTGLMITSIEEDRQHGIWLTTMRTGVHYVPAPFLPYTRLYEMFDAEKYDGDRHVMSASQNGNLYFLHRKGYFLFSDQKSIKTIDLNKTMGMKATTFSSLYVEPTEKNIWFNSDDRISTLTPYELSSTLKDSLSTHIHKGSSVNMINPSFDDAIWFSAGPFIVKLKDGEISRQSKAITGIIQSITESSDQGIWIASTTGLWKYKDDSTYYFGSDDSLLSTGLVELIEFNGALWLDSKKHGLLKMPIGSKSEIFSSANRTFYNPSGFKIVNDELWFISPSYLNKIWYPENDKNRASVSSIKLSNMNGRGSSGILTNWRNKLTYVVSGRLFHFEKLPSFDSLIELPLNIGEIKINNADTAILDNYELHYNQNHISIRYIAISNQQFKEIKYKYRIKGVDPDWIETSDRHVQYTSLPSGHHTFEVYAKGSSENWSKTSVTISFNIAPPYWETWWFILSVTLSVIGLITALVRYRFKQLKREAQLQMALNESQQQALSARMNPHFIFNALNSIKTYVLENDVIKSNDYIARFGKLMRQILDQSQFTLVSLSEELKALDNYVNLELMRGKDRFSYTIDIDPKIDLGKAKVPSLLLQPFVENAIWHGIMPMDKTGHISVSLTLHSKFILCVIEDNGVGRGQGNNENIEHKSASTDISSKRLELINTRFKTQIKVQIKDLVDANGNALGTRITIPLPTEFIRE